MSKGFARNGWPRGNEIITGADFVAHATPNTKGSWVQIDASTAQDVVGLWIGSLITIGISATDTSMLLDIGIGAAASEAVVVSNIPVGGLAGGATTARMFYLPIHIPAGTRIAGRIQAAITIDIFRPLVVLEFGGRPGTWGGYTVAETIGVDTATSAPTTGDLADTAWDEAVASTVNSYRAITFHPCMPPGAAASGAVMTVDVGVGGAGSEQVLGTWWVSTDTSEIVQGIAGPVFVEKVIDAGSRLAIRKNSTADLSGALIGWR